MDGHSGTNELQDQAIQVLAEAGLCGARWWGLKGGAPVRIYFPAPRRDAKAYLTFEIPERVECPTLCIDLRDCGQKDTWYQGQRRVLAKPFLEGYARILGLVEPGLEELFRNDMQYAALMDRADLLPIGGKVFPR